jgi:hypothetical protein
MRGPKTAASPTLASCVARGAAAAAPRRFERHSLTGAATQAGESGLRGL